MRILFAIVVLLISCNTNDVKNTKKTDIKKEENKRTIYSNHYIINRFPKINKSPFSDSVIQTINNYFENINELNLVNDSVSFKFEGNNNEIIGDYIILSDNDSLITFEFFVKKGERIVSYKPAFYDKYNGKLLECEDAIKNISRKKLRNFVEVYNKDFNVDINIDAYNEDSKAKLSYTKKGKMLYLYAGKEGEFGGKYKIEIPLESVLK